MRMQSGAGSGVGVARREARRAWWEVVAIVDDDVHASEGEADAGNFSCRFRVCSKGLRWYMHIYMHKYMHMHMHMHMHMPMHMRM